MNKFNTAGQSVWNKERDAYLREMWLIAPAKSIAKALGVGARTVQTRARKLDLPNKSARTFFVWTPEMDETLVRLWPTHTPEQIALNLGVTLNAVLHRSARHPELVVRRDPPKPPVEDDGPDALRLAPGVFAADPRSYEIIKSVLEG